MADPKIKYDIEANVKGDAEVGQLAGKLDALAQALDGDLKTNALAAAAALRQLGEKQAAIQRFVELKQSAQDAAARLAEAQAAAQKLGRELATAEAPTRAQTGQMAKLSDAVRSAKNEVTTQTAAVIQARGALQQYGVSTANLAQSQTAVKAAVGAAKLEVNALVPAYAKAGQQAVESANQQKRASADVSTGVANIGAQLQKIQQIAIIAIGGGFLGGLAKDALATADSYNNLLARIKLVTGEGALLQSSFAGVSAIALRTNSDLEQTATLFTRIAEAGKSAGLGAQEAATQSLALTETINQAVQLSGGSADSAKAAITQLIQGLQSGVLRGEEFNSVMEQSPRLARALADGLGRTTGELRKMAEAGSLSTEVVIRSLRSQADAIKGEFASLPPTVGRAVETLRTSWMLYIGDLDKGAGITKDVASALNALAGNLNTVLTVVGYAGGAWAAYAVSQKLAQAGAKLTAVSAAEASIAVAGQGAASARAAVSTAAHGTAAGVAATQVAGYGAASAGAGAAVAASGAQLSGLVGNLKTVGGLALRIASKAAIWFTVIYEGIGLIKLAQTALQNGVAKWTGYGDAIGQATEKEKTQAEAAAATADAQFKQAEALRIAKEASFGLSKEAGNLAAKFDTLVKAGDSAAEAIGKIGKDFDLSTLPGIRDAGGVLDKLLADGKLTAAEFQAAWAVALNGKDLAVFETTARAAFAGSKREAELLAQLLDAGLRESVKRAGLDFESLKGGISKVAQSAINDTEAIISGLARLSAQGVDTGRALTASLSKGIDTADTQQALELVKKQIESVRAKLGESITNGLLDQAKQKSLELKDALEKATPGIQSVAEAMKNLGITTDKSLADAAKSAKQSYDFMATSGKASARELSEGFVKSAEAAIAANKGVAPPWVTAQAAVRGYEVQVDSAGKATVRAMGEGAKAADGMTQSIAASTEVLKAQEEAMDRVLMRYKLRHQYTERQIALEEKDLALQERRDALERKRQSVDKDGFSTGKDGNRFVAGSEIATLTGIAAFLKNAGVDDDKTARNIAREFADAQGNVQYMDNPGQKKYGGDTMSMALLKAAERYTFGIGGNGPQSPSTIPKPESPRNVTVNLDVGGRSTPINVASAADADALVNVLKGLQDASRRAA